MAQGQGQQQRGNDEEVRALRQQLRDKDAELQKALREKKELEEKLDYEVEEMAVPDRNVSVYDLFPSEKSLDVFGRFEMKLQTLLVSVYAKKMTINEAINDLYVYWRHALTAGEKKELLENRLRLSDVANRIKAQCDGLVNELPSVLAF